MDQAKNSAEMKYAKAAIDLCVAQLKEDLGAEDADQYKMFANDEMINAKLMQNYVKTHPLPTYAKKVAAPAANTTQTLAAPKANSTASFKATAPANNST